MKAEEKQNALGEEDAFKISETNGGDVPEDYFKQGPGSSGIRYSAT